jgi:hypothetical protein
VDFICSYWTKEYIVQRLKDAGFELTISNEDFPCAEFFAIGAVVFYLRIISWQIADFNVNKYRDRLCAIHQDIIVNGPLQVHDHRILVEAHKPG